MNGAMVKEIRLALRITQLELGLRMNVDRMTVNRWESGKSEIVGPALVLLNQMKEEAFRADKIDSVRLLKKGRKSRRKYPLQR